MSAKRIKQGNKGQILPVALVVGTALMIFALAMVSMLRNTAQMTQKVVKGNQAIFGADLAVEKAVNYLNTGAWGKPKEGFPFLTNYRADFVHKNVPNTWYVVQVNPGNLVLPPGDPYYERTITVDAITFAPQHMPPATPEPTPWTMGGLIPPQVANRRTLQAVVKRGGFNNALTSRGKVGIGGSCQIYWGDVYCFMNTVNPLTDITLDLQTQPVGPGYPEFHTETGCIKKAAGTGIGKGTFCNSDPVAMNFKYYPNDPNMPPEPIVDLPTLKELAKQIYIDPSTGLSSYETGYFYHSPGSLSVGPGGNSMSGGAVGAGVEANHQYNASNEITFNGQMTSVLNRMRKNLGKACDWVGDDKLVFFVDTTDFKDLEADLSNQAIGDGSGGAIEFKGGGYAYDKCKANEIPNGAFHGYMILQGSFDYTGGAGKDTDLYSPGDEWLPESPKLNEPVNFNGFLYVGGNFNKYSGNPVVYGSVYCNGNFSSTGSITIFYREDFDYGILARGGVGITKWRQIKLDDWPANYY